MKTFKQKLSEDIYKELVLFCIGKRTKGKRYPLFASEEELTKQLTNLMLMVSGTYKPDECLDAIREFCSNGAYQRISSKVIRPSDLSLKLSGVGEEEIRKYNTFFNLVIERMEKEGLIP